MIIITGYVRTGTSVLFKCLQDTGYYGGPENDLYGHKYKSHYRPFNVVNRIVNNEIAGTKQLHKKFLSIMDTLHNQMLGDGIEVLKDPIIGNALPIWLEYIKGFKDHKFIHTTRDPLECAKSEVRLHFKEHMPSKGSFSYKMTTKTCMDRYHKHNQMFTTVAKGYDLDWVGLDLSELLDPAKRLKIDKFLGKSISWHRVDKKQSYKETGENH